MNAPRVSPSGFIGVAIAPLCMSCLLLLVGCAGIETQSTPNPVTKSQEGGTGPRKLLIFFDATGNRQTGQTNVRRLFGLVAAQTNPQVRSLYVAGVDSSFHHLTEWMFRRGMKARILEGYKFLARQYRPGDQIYIFGFSRGAHQAIMLAALLAYNGLPSQESNIDEQAEAIWNLWAKTGESVTLQKDWNVTKPPLLADVIKENLHLETRSVEVAFLGLWDTVPGFQFTDYGIYKKEEDAGGRIHYRVQPYPMIREIAHALALDEKRSEFSPVLFCAPLDKERTILHQVWFAGAHSDVGGGYDDSDGLAGLSLNWVLGLLEKHKVIANTPRVFSDATALAHWSFGDWPGNFGSIYEDRIVPDGSSIHPSVDERKRAGKVPVRRNGEIALEVYPSKH